MTACTLPPLTILKCADGSPDWPAVNALARQTILDVLQTVGTVSSTRLDRECRLRGVHHRVTYRARCDLEREGIVIGAWGTSGGRRARLWSVAAP